jgi:hypothetical protein
MKVIKIKAITVASIVLTTFFANTVSSYGSTAKEFIAKYGIATRVPNDYKIRAELDEINRLRSSLNSEQKKLLDERNSLLENAEILQQNINMAEQDKMRVDEYNANLALRKNELLEKKAKLNEEALSYYAQADSAKSKLENNILYGSIEKLKAYDKQYRSTIQMGMRYQALSEKLIFNKSFKEYSYDTSDIEKQYKEQERLYDEAKKIYDSGIKDLESKQSGVINNVEIVPIDVDDFNVGKIDSFAKITDGVLQLTEKEGEYNFTDATRINSLFNGVVDKVGHSNSLGDFIVIRSGSNIRVSYFYLKKMKDLKVGDKIKQYSKIADVEFGSPVRIELYVNGARQDINKILLGR